MSRLILSIWILIYCLFGCSDADPQATKTQSDADPQATKTQEVATANATTGANEAENSTTSSTAKKRKTSVKNTPPPKIDQTEYCNRWMKFHARSASWNAEKKADKHKKCITKMENLKKSAPTLFQSQLECFRVVTDNVGAANCVRERRVGARKAREAQLDTALAEQKDVAHAIDDLGMSVQAPKPWAIKKTPQATVLKGKTGQVVFTKVTCSSAPKAPGTTANALCLKALGSAQEKVLENASGWTVKESKTHADGSHHIRIVNEERSVFEKYVHIIPGPGAAIQCGVNRGGFETEARFDRRKKICASMTHSKAGTVTPKTRPTPTPKPTPTRKE